MVTEWSKMFPTIQLTPFAHRHFRQSPDFRSDSVGTVIGNFSPKQFEQRINENAPFSVSDGYAPFCNLLFYKNFTDANCGTVLITPTNQRYLRSDYVARRPDELPVLSRWFDSYWGSHVAKFLCVVTYSKEQLAKESESIDADLGIVAILGQDDAVEEPMIPITMMRNALGISEGGSGVPLNRDKYMKAVEYWKSHAIVKKS